MWRESLQSRNMYVNPSLSVCIQQWLLLIIEEPNGFLYLLHPRLLKFNSLQPPQSDACGLDFCLTNRVCMCLWQHVFVPLFLCHALECLLTRLWESEFRLVFVQHMIGSWWSRTARITAGWLVYLAHGLTCIWHQTVLEFRVGLPQ